MYIESVHIQNIRGFQDLKVNLTEKRKSPAGWTVIAGRNGTGKTTLLQAIVSAVIGPSSTEVMLEEPDRWIRLNADQSRVDVRVSGDKADWRDADDIQSNFRLGTSWTRKAGPQAHSPRGDINFVHGQFWAGATYGADPRGWCLAAYGANRSDIFPSESTNKLMNAPPRRSAVVSLFKRDASLHAANDWVKALHTDYHHPENDILKRVGQKGMGDSRDEADWQALSPPLAHLRNQYCLLEALLSDGLFHEAPLSPNHSNVNTAHLTRDGIAVGSLPISALGQGYESLALLVADIVRQLAAFFGHAFMGGSKWRGPINGPIIVPHSGVVLIDEMENHLHPQLQQQVGFWLKEHFPNIQFIVTTHSPFICQAADEGGLLRVTDEGQVEHVTGEAFRKVVNGSVDDAVLTDLFGLPYPYSPASRDVRERLGQLESKILSAVDLTPEEQSEREALLKKLPSDPSTETQRILQALQANL